MSSISVNINGITQTISLPYTVPSNTTLILNTNITITSGSQYFVIGGSNVVVDGGYNVVTIQNVSNYTGLFQSDGTSNIYTSIVIQHFGTNTLTGINSVNSTCYNCWYIATGARGVGIDKNGNQNITINYCSSNGKLPVDGSVFLPWTSTGGTINYCYNTGLIQCDSNNLNYNGSALIGSSGGGSPLGPTNAYANYCYNVGTCFNFNSGTYAWPGGIGGNYTTNCFNAGIATNPNFGSSNANCYNASVIPSNPFLSYIYWDELTAESTLTGTPKYYNSNNNPPIQIGPVFGTTWISLAPSMPYILMSDNPAFNTISYINSTLGMANFYQAIFTDAKFS